MKYAKKPNAVATQYLLKSYQNQQKKTPPDLVAPQIQHIICGYSYIFWG